MAMTNGQQYYKRLIEPIEPQMISVIARIVPNSDDAMDVLHNALAAIWSKLGKIDKLTNPHAYILRICVNQAYDAMRKANIRSFHESKVYPRQCKAFENECNNENIDEQMLTYVYEAIRKLSRRQAKCFFIAGSRQLFVFGDCRYFKLFGTDRTVALQQGKSQNMRYSDETRHFND